MDIGKTKSVKRNKPKWVEVNRETSRSQRRSESHFAGRKNTRGYPLGYSHKTWIAHCANK